MRMTEDIVFVGGSEADRKAVAAQHAAYLEANAVFDFDRLQKDIWSAAPQASFFNLNGHTYVGRDHWVRLWKYYKEHMQTGTWVPYDMRGFISGDLATVWCHRKTKLAWTGTDPRPDN